MVSNNTTEMPEQKMNILTELHTYFEFRYGLHYSFCLAYLSASFYIKKQKKYIGIIAYLISSKLSQCEVVDFMLFENDSRVEH